MTWSTILRLAVAGSLAVVAIYFAVTSIHWPLMSDSPVMHYVTFLMEHGMKPYRDITDNNLPGSYLAESAAMHIFGYGDVNWRIYEYFLLGSLTVALTVIASPYDWIAGVYAGGLFILAHAADGPNYAAEREQVLALLLVVAYACLFAAVRRARAGMMLPFGLCAALAASIKPTMGPLAIALLLLSAVIAHRRQLRVGRFVSWGIGGMLLVVAFEAGFLIHYGAVKPFLFVLKTVTPAYLALNHPRWEDMLRGAFPTTMLLVVPFGVVVGLSARAWNWERWALALGAAFGLFSYFAQQKGFVHHRYTFLTFTLLLISLELTDALRRPGWNRGVAIAGLAVVLLVIVPRYVKLYKQQPAHNDFTRQLEGDLVQLGDQELQGKVQCFDLVYGCLNALYHRQLVENTGFTGDLLFFAPGDTPARRYYRNLFWALAQRDPATVLVISNEWFGMPNSFDKLNAWPEFTAYLQANYSLLIVRRFPNETGISRVSIRSTEPNAYRIYIRKGSLLSDEQRQALLL